ncbi:hypothetical protein RRG08_064139 [Elysia crispata]|uniref:Uncharacterized protein n=1 Tax=Elysia crispata TaxID=231223 RepID=A0AAE1DJA7_9GAST|nr:hypothetical protein RRG08_064139 [Elysia crispata]
MTTEPRKYVRGDDRRDSLEAGYGDGGGHCSTSLTLGADDDQEEDNGTRLPGSYSMLTKHLKCLWDE